MMKPWLDAAQKEFQLYHPTQRGDIQVSYWYKFTEHNDNEGETWHFFIQLSAGERDHLEMLLEDFDLEHYSISQESYPELEVDILVKHSDCGYMNTYNKRPAPYSVSIFDLPEEAEELDEIFYKGGNW